ncbi:MAG: hypothetical protein R3Y19_02500 [Rikenellaceae bacterium]
MNTHNIARWVSETLEELTQAHWTRNSEGQPKALDDIRGCCETAIKLIGVLEKCEPEPPQSAEHRAEQPIEIDLNLLSRSTIEELLTAIQPKDYDTKRPTHQNNTATQQTDQPSIGY